MRKGIRSLKYALVTVNLTLFPPKTNIFVQQKCTFSKKGLGHKGRCYSVCIDDTCKWISHTLSRIIGPSNTPTKIRLPISDTGHMAQISLNFMRVHAIGANSKVYLCSVKFSISMQIHAYSLKIYSCSHKILHEFAKYQYQSTSPSVVNWQSKVVVQYVQHLQ